VDTLAATLLGFNPLDVGYLVLAEEDGYGTMDLAKITLTGNSSLADAYFPLKPPPRFETLVQWRD
jgi:hypothetical protein